MHSVNINSKLRSDLVLENNSIMGKTRIINKKNNLKVIKNDIDNYSYTTIIFNDITDKNNYIEVQNTFIDELKEYLNISNSDTFLVIGLGNDKSTPDSLGPMTIDNILVTRYLFLLGDVESGYSNVAGFSPDVVGNTGIETANIVKSIIKEINVNKVIIIDSLKTYNIDRLVKTIQITNKGISPGSGINNNREEISKDSLDVDVIAIGIPTVVDIKSILDKYMDKKINVKDNLIVTPTNIDFLIDKLSMLISGGINICLHKKFIRQK